MALQIAVSEYLTGILFQGMSCHPLLSLLKNSSGNHFIMCNCFLLSFVSGVASADGLFIGNLGKVKAGARFCSCNLFQVST